MSGLTVSILIPTYNAGSLWPTVLKAINAQTLQNTRKIIIDSGSVDDTVAQAKAHGFEVKQIATHTFNHGATRQLLADTAATDIVVFLTQDAIPADSQSLQHIVDVFNNAEIGLAYGRQLPHKNAKPLETHARYFNYPEIPAVRSLSNRQSMGFKVFFCSNSFAAYRRSALTAVGGFPTHSIMGEDAIVAAKMLLAGYKIAYAANAMVHHSHSYKLKEEFKRYFDTRVFHEQNKWLINEFGKPTGEGIRFVKSELQYVLKNDKKSLFKSVFSLFAKWAGYKLGKYYKSLPLKAIKLVSMHQSYWK